MSYGKPSKNRTISLRIEWDRTNSIRLSRRRRCSPNCTEYHTHTTKTWLKWTNILYCGKSCIHIFDIPAFIDRSRDMIVPPAFDAMHLYMDQCTSCRNAVVSNFGKYNEPFSRMCRICKAKVKNNMNEKICFCIIFWQSIFYDRNIQSLCMIW